MNLQTGRGGEFYIESPKSGTFPTTVRIEGKPRQFDLIIAQSDDTFVELGTWRVGRAPESGGGNKVPTGA